MRFTIRDILLVTVIVAVCVAWLLDHLQQERNLARARSISTSGRAATWHPPRYVPPNSSAPAPNPPKP